MQCEPGGEIPLLNCLLPPTVSPQDGPALYHGISVSLQEVTRFGAPQVRPLRSNSKCPPSFSSEPLTVLPPRVKE
uniref:Uncharacterized protein n=1 Tax=Anguilla anguilla TaxID=7936 RepID=A0A0E9RKV3_ANGAN